MAWPAWGLSAVEQQKENATVEVLSFPPPWGSTREEVLEDKFAELLGGLTADDEVLDWGAPRAPRKPR